MPGPLQLGGIALVCGGVIAMGLSHRATIGQGLAYALATGFTIGCYTLIDASGVRATATPSPMCCGSSWRTVFACW